MNDFAPLRDPRREAPRRKTDIGGPLSRSYWLARGVVPRWQLLAVYLFVSIAAIIGFIRIGNQASNAESIARENRHLVIVTNRLAGESAQLARSLQEQRLDSIRRTCEDQNHRHDRTIRKLDAVLRRAVPDRATRVRIRTQNALLIDALAPHQDCAKVVARATRAP